MAMATTSKSLQWLINWCAVGASRAAVTLVLYQTICKWVKQVKSLLHNYMLLLVSLVPFNVAGMKDSKVIVAIKRRRSSNLQVADYGIVGDLFDLVPQLEKLV